MGRKKLHKNKNIQSNGNNNTTLNERFVLTDVSKDELNKRRIPVYSYLL